MLSDDFWEPAVRPRRKRRKPRKNTLVGVAVRHKRERTAFAVAELQYRSIERPGGRSASEPHYVVRFLDRLPIGTPYPEIAERLGVDCTRTAEQSNRQPTVYADLTGVGAPVAELFREHVPRATLWAVYFNHGDRRQEDGERRQVTLGKAYLVSRLQTQLQSHRLHLPKTTEAETLAQELLAYEIKVASDANDRYGAFKVGTQDDLVTALGLAVHHKPRRSVYW